MDEDNWGGRRRRGERMREIKFECWHTIEKKRKEVPQMARGRPKGKKNKPKGS